MAVPVESTSLMNLLVKCLSNYVVVEFITTVGANFQNLLNNRMGDIIILKEYFFTITKLNCINMC